MNKLKLDLDSLDVTSFTTQSPDTELDGTVMANSGDTPAIAVMMAKALADAAAAAAHAAGQVVGALLS